MAIKGGKKTGGKQKGYIFPATLAREAAKEHLRTRLTAHVDDFVDALVSRSKGVRYFVTRNKTGKFEIVTDPTRVVAALNGEDDMQGEFYTDKPDVTAIKEALERMVGQSDKPVEEHNVNVTLNLDDRIRQARKRISEK